MATRAETAVRNRLYNQLLSRLTATLPVMKQRYASLASCDLVGTHPKDLLAQVDALSCDLVGQKSDVDGLMECGEELMSILEELDCKDTPKAKEILCNLNYIRESFTDLTKCIEEKQTHLKDVLVQYEASELELNSLLDWIQETWTVLKLSDQTSLDLSVLKEQLSTHSKLLSDVLTHEPKVCLVSDQCRSLGICDRVSELLSMFHELSSQVNARDQKFQNILAKLSRIKTDSAQISQWILETSPVLECQSKNEMLQTLMDSLYYERMEMEKSLEWIRKTGKELISDASCCDASCLRDLLANLQSSWRDLTSQMISAMAGLIQNNMDELQPFVSKTEEDLSLIEVIVADPEEVSLCLHHHKILHEEVSAKLHEVDLQINRFEQMLNDHLSNESHKELTSGLAALRKRLDAVLRLSEKRIAMLSEVLPLVSHLHQTYTDLNASLSDVQNDIDSLDVNLTENTEHIRMNQQTLKLMHQLVEDSQTTVDDVVSVGHDLKSLCCDCDCSQPLQLVTNITDKYEDVKQSLKRKSVVQEETFRRAFTDVSDTLLDLLSKAQILSDRVTYADNIAANIFVLNQQLTENKDVIAELHNLKSAVHETSLRIENLTESSSEADDDGKRSEVQARLEDILALHASTECAAQQRTDVILKMLGAAEKFFFDFLAVSEALHDLRDQLTSQGPLAATPEAVIKQKTFTKRLEDELERACLQMERCLQTSAPALESLGAVDADREIKKCSDDFDDLQEEIRDAIRTRLAELDEALEVAENFANYSKSVKSWLPDAEAKMASMSPIADSARAIRIQIEEFKVFKVQICLWYSDIHRLGQFLNELMTISSPDTVETLVAEVKDINARWQDLIRSANQREENLRSALIELGEIDHAIEDVLGLLQQIESDLLHFNEVYGDPRYLEIHLKKVEVLLKDLASQKGIINKLDVTIEAVVRRSGRKSSPLAERQHEMMSLFSEVQASARDRRDELLDRLKQVKGFVGSIDEIIKWLTNFKWQLKVSRPMGALLDSAHVQYNRTMVAYQELEMKEMEVTALLLNAEDMFCRCQQHEMKGLQQKLSQLQVLMYETKTKAKLIKKKIEDHIEKVEKFHCELGSQTKWLNDMEKRLRCFRHPSKLVEKVLLQMQQLQECDTDIKAHSESMKAVDQNGTYLKYFGSKQDTVYIKDLLMSTRIRWKKLLQTADEAQRILKHACRENKRFFESWKALCDWMSEAEGKFLHKYMICSSVRTKQDMDDLKRFDLQMSAKQPLYCVTRRQGTSMRDGCAKSDPERAILNEMVEELSSRWTQLRSIILQRQEKGDDCLLLSPGHYSDTLESMLTWLKKSEVYLSDKQLIFGDINTVALLMDQHKEFQQELLRRMDVIQKIPDSIPVSKNNFSEQLMKVKTLLCQVHHMSETRQASLHEAVNLAEDFNESLEDIHKWLPLAEAELKFCAIPNDEDGIIRLIENHEKFHEDLIGQEPNIEKMTYIAEEILVSCHPNAVSIIRYHMTIMQTRWQQALRRSKARSERLQNALKDIQRSATLEEELSAWLISAEAQLMEKQKEILPSDRISVEALLNEQVQFHHMLFNRSKDLDKLQQLSRITGSFQNQRHSNHHSQSTPTPKELTSLDNNATEFRQKWQSLWQTSADRKKLLENLAKQLTKEERGESFDFDQWRMMAQDWFRARKLRISDVFRQQDRNCKGVVTKKQFVESMLTSKFPSSANDLRTIFDILDTSCSGIINYRDFVKAILSDYQSFSFRESPSINESDLIREEIRQQTSRCQCPIPFSVQRIDDSKYKFGEKGKLCLVRFVNSSITVRVGGGWMTIGEFMDNFDPCRVKMRPSSRAGLTTPPERSFSGRGSRTSPENGLAPVSEMPTATSGKDQETVKLPLDVHRRSEKSTAAYIGPRPKGLSIKQSTSGVSGTPNSPKVSLGNSTRSPTSKRKSFHDNRKQNSVQ